MKLVTGGELLAMALARQGARHVFSISGGQLATVYDAMGRHPDMEVVTPRCETSAPLMACGYAAASGRPGVSMTTVGAGVVYEAAGLLYAWQNYLPVMSVAPQVQSWKIRPFQESLQACGQDELYPPMTRFAAIGHHWDRVPSLVDHAFREAVAGVPGPVHLDFPVDVLFARKFLTEKRRARLFPPVEHTRAPASVPGDPAALREAAALLKTWKQPVVILGQSMGLAGRFPGVLDSLAELGPPVVTTRASSGAYGPRAGQSLVLFRSPGVRGFLEQADGFVVLGMDPDAAQILDLARRNLAVIQVETDPRALVRRSGYLSVQADPESAARAWMSKIGGRKNWSRIFSAGLRTLAAGAAGPVSGLAPAMGSLARDLAVGDILVAEDGRAALAAASFLASVPFRTFLTQGRAAAGAGLPFAVGAALGSPGARVVLAADGESLFHHLRELFPAACLNLDLTILCVDSDGEPGISGEAARAAAALGWPVEELAPGAALPPGSLAPKTGPCFFRVMEG